MSALTNFKGDSPWLYDTIIQTAQSPAYISNMVMDATAEKLAFIGCVWHPTVKTGTINIRKVHFRTGAITFNALSTVRVSLQNVSATAGPPYQPDGSQDQTYDFASGAGLSANTWTATGNLSADRAVDLSALSIGDANSRWVAVVFEFQTFTAADSIVVSNLNVQATPINTLLGGQPLINTGSWSVIASSAGVVALECDDGTYAFMETMMPFSALSSASVASNGAIRAAGLKFRFPVEMKTEAAGIGLVIPNGCDGSLILYDTDGTTALVTVAIDNDSTAAASLMRHSMARYLPVTHTANSYYRLVFVASTTTAASVYYGTVNAAAIMDGLAGGQDFHWTERDSAGTWTDTTTRRPHFVVKLSAVHDGAGGGGGMLVHPGLSGGARG
jgi:hypothetical protein